MAEAGRGRAPMLAWWQQTSATLTQGGNQGHRKCASRGLNSICQGVMRRGNISLGVKNFLLIQLEPRHLKKIRHYVRYINTATDRLYLCCLVLYRTNLD